MNEQQILEEKVKAFRTAQCKSSGHWFRTKPGRDGAPQIVVCDWCGKRWQVSVTSSWFGDAG